MRARINGPDAGSGAVDAAGLPADALRIFVTSTAYERDLGGADGAAGLCNAAAASLPGTYNPWISDDTSDALTRVVGEGPWYDTADRLVFNNRANLSTSPQIAIGRDEQGNEIPISSTRRVWTGTAAGRSRQCLQRQLVRPRKHRVRDGRVNQRKRRRVDRLRSNRLHRRRNDGDHRLPAATVVRLVRDWSKRKPVPLRRRAGKR